MNKSTTSTALSSTTGLMWSASRAQGKRFKKPNPNVYCLNIKFHPDDPYQKPVKREDGVTRVIDNEVYSFCKNCGWIKINNSGGVDPHTTNEHKAATNANKSKQRFTSTNPIIMNKKAAIKKQAVANQQTSNNTKSSVNDGAGKDKRAKKYEGKTTKRPRWTHNFQAKKDKEDKDKKKVVVSIPIENVDGSVAKLSSGIYQNLSYEQALSRHPEHAEWVVQNCTEDDSALRRYREWLIHHKKVTIKVGDKIVTEAAASTTGGKGSKSGKSKSTKAASKKTAQKKVPTSQPVESSTKAKKASKKGSSTKVSSTTTKDTTTTKKSSSKAKGKSSKGKTVKSKGGMDVVVLGDSSSSEEELSKPSKPKKAKTSTSTVTAETKKKTNTKKKKKKKMSFNAFDSYDSASDSSFKDDSSSDDESYNDRKRKR